MFHVEGSYLVRYTDVSMITRLDKNGTAKARSIASDEDAVGIVEDLDCTQSFNAEAAVRQWSLVLMIKDQNTICFNSHHEVVTWIRAIGNVFVWVLCSDGIVFGGELQACGGT